eukprot:637178-Pyramimonas_sp.AAC.1
MMRSVFFAIEPPMNSIFFHMPNVRVARNISCTQAGDTCRRVLGSQQEAAIIPCDLGPSVDVHLVKGQQEAGQCVQDPWARCFSVHARARPSAVTQQSIA